MQECNCFIDQKAELLTRLKTKVHERKFGKFSGLPACYLLAMPWLNHMLPLRYPTGGPMA